MYIDQINSTKQDFANNIMAKQKKSTVILITIEFQVKNDMMPNLKNTVVYHKKFFMK